MFRRTGLVAGPPETITSARRMKKIRADVDKWADLCGAIGRATLFLNPFYKILPCISLNMHMTARV